MCFEYDEYSSVYDERYVTTRKPHRCEGCHKWIPARTQAKCCSGLFDGAWFRYYVCNRCERMLLAIVVKELKDGCPWHTAWCAPQDLQDYLHEQEKWTDEEYGEFASPELRPLGMRTLQDCRRVVDDLHMTMTGYARPDDTERCFAV